MKNKKRIRFLLQISYLKYFLIYKFNKFDLRKFFFSTCIPTYFKKKLKTYNTLLGWFFKKKKISWLFPENINSFLESLSLRLKGTLA